LIVCSIIAASSADTRPIEEAEEAFPPAALLGVEGEDIPNPLLVEDEVYVNCRNSFFFLSASSSDCTSVYPLTDASI
jgi:hypothetical protein